MDAENARFWKFASAVVLLTIFVIGFLRYGDSYMLEIRDIARSGDEGFGRKFAVSVRAPLYRKWDTHDRVVFYSADALPDRESQFRYVETSPVSLELTATNPGRYAVQVFSGRTFKPLTQAHIFIVP